MTPSTSTFSLNMILTGTTTARLWNIRISQIPCGTSYTGLCDCNHSFHACLINNYFYLQHRIIASNGLQIQQERSCLSIIFLLPLQSYNIWPIRTIRFASEPIQYIIIS